MATGANLWTAYDGPAPLQSARQPAALPAGATGLRLTAPGGSATVVGPSDVGACKAYLTVIDAVLLPWSPAQLAALAAAPPTAGSGALLGAALSSGVAAAANATDGAALASQCTLQANTVFNGTAVAPGASNRQRSGELGGRAGGRSVCEATAPASACPWVACVPLNAQHYPLLPPQWATAAPPATARPPATASSTAL